MTQMTACHACGACCRSTRFQPHSVTALNLMPYPRVKHWQFVYATFTLSGACPGPSPHIDRIHSWMAALATSYRRLSNLYSTLTLFNACIDLSSYVGGWRYRGFKAPKGRRMMRWLPPYHYHLQCASFEDSRANPTKCRPLY